MKYYGESGLLSFDFLDSEKEFNFQWQGHY